MIIKNDDEADAALKLFEPLMANDPPYYSPDGDLLQILAEAIEHYEDRTLGNWFEDGGK